MNEVREQEVHRQFMLLKKSPQQSMAQGIAALYQQHQLYSRAVIHCTATYLKGSLDERRASLYILAAGQWRGVARTTLVKQFLQPVLALFQNNTEQSLILPLQQALISLLFLGGNSDEKKLICSLKASLGILANRGSKDIRKICAYGILRIMVNASPYVTFKWLDERTEGETHLTKVVDAGCSRNAKIRLAYVSFLQEYTKYIAQKKNNAYQKHAFKKLLDLSHSQKDNNQESILLCLETTCVLLKHLSRECSSKYVSKVLQFTLEQVKINKSGATQKGLIQLLPRVANLTIAPNSSIQFIKYLLSVREQEVSAHQALEQVIKCIRFPQAIYLDVIRDVLHCLGAKMQRSKPQSLVKILSRLPTLIKDEYFSQLVSTALLLHQGAQTLQLLTTIKQYDCFNLSRSFEIKLLLIITKILTSDTNRNLHQNQQIVAFVQQLDKNKKFDSERSKVHALYALSKFAFSPQFKPTVHSLIRERVLKQYLPYGTEAIKIIAVDACFVLSPFDCLDLQLRIGMTDKSIVVQEKVFKTLYQHIAQQNINQCNQMSTIQKRSFKSKQSPNKLIEWSDRTISHLMQAVRSKSNTIKIYSLKILCILQSRGKFPLIYPFLKKLLYRCLYHIRTSFKLLEYKLSLLQAIQVFVERGPNMVQAHAGLILTSLMQYISTEHYELTATVQFDECILSLIQSFANELPHCLLPHLKRLSLHVLRAMEDKLNFKYRAAALKTFASMVLRCGYTGVPHAELPTLRPTLAYLTSSELEGEERVDLMRIIGGLGIVGDTRIRVQDYHFTHFRDKEVNRDSQIILEEQLQAFSRELKLFQTTTIMHFQSPVPRRKQRQYQIKKVNENKTKQSIHVTVVRHLISILQDISLEQKHSLCIQTLTKALKCIPFQDSSEVFPLLLECMSTNPSILPCVLTLAQICELSPFLDNLLRMVLQQPNTHTMVRALEVIAVRGCLRLWLGQIVTTLHTVVEDHETDKGLMLRVLAIYRHLKLEMHTDDVLPQLIIKFVKVGCEVGGSVLDLIRGIARRSSTVLQYLPMLVPAITQLLYACDAKHLYCKPCLKEKVAACVVTLVVLNRNTMATYLPAIHQAFLSLQQMPTIYVKMLRHLQELTLKTIDQFFNEEQILRLSSDIGISYSMYILHIVGDYSINSLRSKKFSMSDEVLLQLQTVQSWQEQDWQHWLQRISLLLLRTSPQAVLQSCSDLVQDYPQLSLQLINTSFLTHWQWFGSEQRHRALTLLVRTMHTSTLISVRKTILCLLQCVARHSLKTVSLQESFGPHALTLANTAWQLSAPAKQLYFREMCLEQAVQKEFDSLIAVHMQMGERENAKGVIQVAAAHRVVCPTAWYYQIGDYERAYHMYSQESKRNKVQLLRCLSHYDHQQYINQYQSFDTAEEELKLLAVQAYSNLRMWDSIERIVPQLEAGEDKSLWEAIVAVKNGKDASAIIAKTRELVFENQLPKDLVRLQQICQLEEISLGRVVPSTWEDRMRCFPQQSEMWEKISTVRQLSLNDSFDFDYLHCEICLKRNRLEKCRQYIRLMKQSLQRMGQIKQNKRGEMMIRLLESKVTLAQGKWNLDKVEKVLVILEGFVGQIAFLKENGKRVGELYFQCAEWLRENHTTYPMEEQLKLYQKAANVGQSKQTWQMLGAMQLELSKQYKVGQDKSQIRGNLINNSFISIVHSLQDSSDDKSSLLQGYLKMLSLLHGEYELVVGTFRKYYKIIPIEGWINAVPQIVAQLQCHSHTSPSEPVYDEFIQTLKQLCSYIGKQRPQQILFALNLSICSGVKERAAPAREVVQSIRLEHATLVRETELAAQQLGWAAVKLRELWPQTLEAAWQAWTQQNKSHAVFLLMELHEETISRSNAGSEYAFYQEYQCIMKQGIHWVREYCRTEQDVCMGQAFALFLQITKLSQESGEKNRKVLYVRETAPGLLRDWKELCVPGERVKIHSIGNELRILPSKQRPRKISIEGEDNKVYNFLLKGREDLRLDERVMQFLGLVNKLLQETYHVLKKDLQIIRYPIIPLTRSTGLIGWVEESDTITQLIREHRANRNIRHYVEKEYYERTCANFLNLPAMNKLQIFRSGQEVSQSRDLQDILWLKAANCEEQFEHRNNFTTSLATMSMVGYILGLGDRHLSNLLLHRPSGKILHIDFGDCFEVAMLRDRFPQKVPFRLTRLLQKAMGVSSIYGLFKSTSCVVMRTSRKYKETLFGVLETFVHDPILSWQATQGKKQDGQRGLLNEKADYALSRVKKKLRGSEGKTIKSVEEQVKKLIQDATSDLNICQSWLGWCPFW